MSSRYRMRTRLNPSNYNGIRSKSAEKRERLERRARRGISEDPKAGFLGSIQRSQPALTEALKLQEQAARVGFDWSAAEPILDKIEEEIGELRQALAEGDTSRISDELGDLIFAVVNIGRHVKKPILKTRCVAPIQSLDGVSGTSKPRSQNP